MLSKLIQSVCYLGQVPVEIPAQQAWEAATTDKLKKLLYRAGPGVALFVLPLSFFSGMDKEAENQSVICGYVERRHKLEDNYKVDILPIQAEGEEEIYSPFSFYLSDFVSLLQSGTFLLTSHARYLIDSGLELH